MCNGYTFFFVSRSLLASKLLCRPGRPRLDDKLGDFKTSDHGLLRPAVWSLQRLVISCHIANRLFIFLLCFIDLSLTILAYDVLSTPYFFLYLVLKPPGLTAWGFQSQPLLAPWNGS